MSPEAPKCCGGVEIGVLMQSDVTVMMAHLPENVYRIGTCIVILGILDELISQSTEVVLQFRKGIARVKCEK